MCDELFVLKLIIDKEDCVMLREALHGGHFSQNAKDDALRYATTKSTTKSSFVCILHVLLTLIRHGANVNTRIVRDESNDTLLHRATTSGSISVSFFLLGAGADPNARNEHDQTPLHTLVNGALATRSECSANVLQLLLESGADPNARDIRGLTVMHYFAAWCTTDFTALVTRIVEWGGDASITDGNGRTALDVATALQNDTAIAILTRLEPCAPSQPPRQPAPTTAIEPKARSQPDAPHTCLPLKPLLEQFLAAAGQPSRTQSDIFTAAYPDIDVPESTKQKRCSMYFTVMIDALGCSGLDWWTWTRANPDRRRDHILQRLRLFLARSPDVTSDQFAKALKTFVRETTITTDELPDVEPPPHKRRRVGIPPAEKDGIARLPMKPLLEQFVAAAGNSIAQQDVFEKAYPEIDVTEHVKRGRCKSYFNLVMDIVGCAFKWTEWTRPSPNQRRDRVVQQLKAFMVHAPRVTSIDFANELKDFVDDGAENDGAENDGAENDDAENEENARTLLELSSGMLF